ncbi:MAG: EAL domain-containing protein [Lachnospiraceae bacterium]
MELAFYITLVIAFVLLVILVALAVKTGKITNEKKQLFDDNKKLYAKVHKMEGMVKEAVQAKENLNTIHEELKDRYETVNRIAYTDSLTDLPNRQQFMDILDGVIITLRDSEKAAISVIKVASYERITNATGHVSGDELILDFAQRLKANLTEDDFLARIGNDEFAIISQNFTSSVEFEERLGRLYRVIKSPYSTGGRDIIPVVYTAAAIAPTDGKTVQLLTLNVRLALSRAISEGAERVYFYAEAMADEAMKKMELSAELNQSVENGRITYLCGAQTDLKTGSIASFEILPVWDSERYGRLYPRDYLKYAEDTQIAKKIFISLLREACAKQKLFENSGYNKTSFLVPCFVGQFIDDDFVKIVYNILEQTDATPDRILISVPEKVILKNPQASVNLMRKIEKLGIRFVLDDFGSGSSSLKALIKAPISLVRLSQDFIDGESRVGDEQVLSSLIELTHSWKLKLIVTGVDFKEQETLLKKLHADYAQGMLYNGYMNDEVAMQIARITQK